MRRLTWLFPALVVVVVAGALAWADNLTPLTITSASGTHRFSVEYADTPDRRAVGLMHRAAMAADHGMLFAFPQAQPLTFWMKDTLIPLDMLFFDEAHRLVTIRADVPPCQADPCPTYASTAPARYVLELNAGTAAKLDLHKGDVITFSDVPSGTQ